VSIYYVPVDYWPFWPLPKEGKMKEFKKSQFLSELYMVVGALNCDSSRRNNPDDDYFEKYLAFTKMEECGLTEKSHGWLDGKGYAKKCPITTAVLFLAHMMRRQDTVPMESVMANAMILLEYTEAAWEEYEVLLKRHLEAKAALLAGLHSIAAEESARAGLN